MNTIVVRRRRYNEHSVVDTPAIMEQVASVPEAVDDAVMEADPDEPRYCICNEVAFGDMVACDNKKVGPFVSELHRIIGFDYFNVILFSVLTNGTTTHALASRVHRKENGTVLSAQPE